MSIQLPASSVGRQQFQETAARSRDVRSKEDFVLSFCRDQQVLDVGCINHSAQNALALGQRWLHRRIRDVATQVTGLDLLSADAATLTGHGYDIVTGDAEHFDLGRTFDAIIAADLIEHLSNMRGFLASARRHMTAESLLVLTTPNPFSFAQMMQVLLRGKVVVNAQHTVWLDPSVMYELLSRQGFEIVDFSWIDSDPDWQPTTWPTRALAAADQLVGRVRPLCRANYGLAARAV